MKKKIEDKNNEIKNRKHSFKVILVITIICIIINILECVNKQKSKEKLEENKTEIGKKWYL